MKISKSVPSIYKKCKEQFGVDWDRGIIITYGDTVYCKYPLDEFKTIHELTHVNQQTAMGKDLWWDKYLTDKEFRLSQEVEAYKKEADYIRATVKDRNKQAVLLHKIYSDLSSSIYGNICSYSKAKFLTK